MAIVGSLVTILSGNNAPLLATLGSSEAAMKGYASSSSANAAIARSALLGIGAVAAVGIGMAVNAARDFQSQMAIVNTIAHQTPTELKATGDAIRALSVATGSPLDDLTSSFYDLLSVGVPVGNAMEFLTNATTLSIGGLSTSKEAVDAITTSINAWSGATGTANLTMADSAKVADLWAKGIEVGGFTAADIGSALSNVAAQASTFNTPLEQVVATTALLTTRGFTASTALTSMDAAFTALQRVPPGMEDLQKKTGKTYEQIARTEGIHEAIVQIVADAEQFGIGLVDVFGRTDALGYVINTTGNSAKAYEDILTSMYDSSGTAAGQAAERSATMDRQMAILGATVNDLAITLGTALLPPLTTFVQSVNGVVQGISSWAAANPELAGTILPIIAAVSALGILALSLGPVFAVAGAAVMIALNPVVLLIAGLVLSIQSIQSFIDKNNTIAANNPGAMPHDIAREKWETGDAAYRTYAEKHGYSPANNFGGAGSAAYNTPGFFASEGGSPFARPAASAAFGGSSPDDRRPIALSSTTNVHMDGQKVGEVIERRMFNDTSAWNSGFSNPGSNPIQ